MVHFAAALIAKLGQTLLRRTLNLVYVLLDRQRTLASILQQRAAACIAVAHDCAKSHRPSVKCLAVLSMHRDYF